MNIKTLNTQPKAQQPQTQSVFNQAEKLLEQGKTAEAEALLTANKTLADSPRTKALLGASYFRQEKYAAAADAFETLSVNTGSVFVNDTPLKSDSLSSISVNRKFLSRSISASLNF